MDLHEKYGLTRVINACGKMTHLAGAVVPPDIAEQASTALTGFFDLEELQNRAGETIANWSGAEWGCVTACTAAGLTLGVAACMTGKDLGRIAQLPDTKGLRNEVILQKGHAINFGAPITQIIRLAGARVVEVGTVHSCDPFHIEHAISDRTAAVLFVVSHHTVRYGCTSLAEVVEIASGHGIPVIVDGAAQSFLMSRIVATGVDLVVCSGHKYLSGTTAGIACGRRTLIEAVKMQTRGIGRPMKVGKEGIFGAMAALERRAAMDVDDWQREQESKTAHIIDRLGTLDGIATSSEVDPNGNPFNRARLDIDFGKAGISAKVLSQALADGKPSIRVRAHHVDEGYLMVDAIELTKTEVDFVCDRIEYLLLKTTAEKARLMSHSGDIKTDGPEWTWLRDPAADVQHITGI